MKTTDRQPWIRAFRDECEGLGFAWTESSLQRPSGTTTALFIGRPGTPQSKVVAFIHGLGDDLLFPQVRLFRHLLASGWAIATCDQDGHGQNNSSIFSASQSRDAAASLVAFIESVIPGREKLHLAGFSLGAAVMLDYAVHSPERIQSLTLIGMPLEWPSGFLHIGELKGLFSSSFEEAQKEFGWWGALPAFGPFKRSQFPVRCNSPHQSSYLSEAARLLTMLEPVQALRVVSFPTLCVLGAQDTLALSRHSKSLNSLSPHIQLQWIEGASHFTSLLHPKTWKRIEIFLRAATRQS